MIRKTLSLCTLLALMSTCPAGADTDPAMPSAKLNELSANKVPGVADSRGGAGTSKPLGFYTGGTKVEFRSSYAKQAPASMAEFALALHDFVLSKDGGYDKFFETYRALKAKAQTHTTIQNRPVDAKAMEMLEDEMSWKDALAKVHVSYDLQVEFAKQWWTKKNNDYMASGLAREWFLNDAVLDATNLWMNYETKFLSADDGFRNRYAQYELEKIGSKH